MRRARTITAAVAAITVTAAGVWAVARDDARIADMGCGIEHSGDSLVQGEAVGPDPLPVVEGSPTSTRVRFFGHIEMTIPRAWRAWRGPSYRFPSGARPATVHIVSRPDVFLVLCRDDTVTWNRLRSDVVIIESWTAPGFDTRRTEPDTVRPLRLADFELDEHLEDLDDRSFAEMRMRRFRGRVIVAGRTRFVAISIGPHVPRADRAALDRVLASIWWPSELAMSVQEPTVCFVRCGGAPARRAR